MKKRRLVKVLSNRLLQENLKVNVLSKDPFFDEKSALDIPFISPYVQSKLAITAVNLRDMDMLKSLLNDTERIANLHIGRSAYNNLIAAQYAIKYNMRDALELLIDDFVKPKPDRIQIAETMFERFSTGSYNQRSLGIPFTRKLTESRGAKEGNAAFSKDQCTFRLVGKSHSNQREFFKCLFDYALENGVSLDLFDFLILKWRTATEATSKNMMHYDNRIVYENIWRCVLNGHRKLAAHVIQSAPPGHGFNSVHTEVLRVENDAELTCQLRANMCTKKPYSNDLITPIHCASINPNVKYLKTLLSITQDFNIADKRGRRPVHFAAVCEGPTPLEYLISRVSPYELDTTGNTPLHFACLAGRSLNVEILLNYAQKKQEDDSALTTEVLIDNKYGLGGINKPNRRGQLPIHLAIGRSNYECVKVLLKYNCNVEYPLPNSKDKITPLMYACQMGNGKIVRLLIENGAKVEARDRYQKTALIHAIVAGHADIMSYLLRLGASPNAVDSSGNSCLHYACAYGWYFGVKMLLESGAHLNLLNDWRLTPFGAAFLKGHVGICEQLLAHSKEIDVNFRTEDGETLVMLCVSSTSVLNDASVEQLDYIVNKLGGNCQLVDSKGNNAFHYLAANKIETHAIEAQLKDSIENADTSTPEFKKLLNEKIYEQEDLRYKMAKILLNAKCNPSTLNNQLESPLFVAINSCNAKFARYLLVNRSINSRITSKQNSSGKTLLSLMADKCSEIDACSIIFDETYSDQELFKRYANEFEQMARVKDNADQTPFQICTGKIKAYLQVNAQLSESLTRFLLFLYKDCKSDPNKLIYESKEKKDENYSGSTKNQSNTSDDDMYELELESNESENDSETTKPAARNHEQKVYYPPIFNLISHKSIELLDKLLDLVQKNSELPKINLSSTYDSEGLTPLLKSISLKETDFAIKLIELELASRGPDQFLANIASQVCQKTNVAMLNENVLQLSLRNGFQFAFINKLIDLLSNIVTSSNESLELLVKFLKHENAYKQNFLHVLASLNASEHKPNLMTLTNFATKLNKILAHSNHNKTLLLKLASSQDKLGRNPLHLCLYNSATCENSSNIDFEIFFMEKLFNIVHAADDLANIKSGIFSAKDIFERIPLHYLFYNVKSVDQDTFKTSDLYKAPSLSKIIAKKLLYFNEESYLPVCAIDPVELLTIIIKQTNAKKFIDEKDFAGYTPLHYACMRGSIISCTILLSYGANIFNRSTNGLKTEMPNTPLSSAIFFKRESCTLTLLNHIKEKCDDEKFQSSLNDFYYLHPKYYIPAEEQDEEEEEEANNGSNNLAPTLKWAANQSDKDLYPNKSTALYQLILENKWQGINWLVLGDLNVFGLCEFVSIQTSIQSGEFSLALRLIEKLEQKMSKMNVFSLLTSTKSKNNRTILHTIAMLDAPQAMSSNDKDTLTQILGKIFPSPAPNEKFTELLNSFLLHKDQYGSNALHYACCMHNFDLVDFVFGFLSSDNKSSLLPTPESLLKQHKDAAQQTAYSLLFWQLGRVVYSKETKEKIKSYTQKLESPASIENVAKAAFPRIVQPTFTKTDDSQVNGEFIHDYPNLESQPTQLISPLLYAINRQSFDMCKFLLKDLGFDVNTCDFDKASALVYVIHTNNLDICKLLLNHDYEINAKPNVSSTSNQTNTNKASSRMKFLFNSGTTKNMLVSQQAAKQDEDDEYEESSEEEIDEGHNGFASPANNNETNNNNASDAQNSQVQTEFKLKSSIVLNNLDVKSKTVFHHLACSLTYGSFSNLDMCKLLVQAYQHIFNDSRVLAKMVPLIDFLGRVDSNIKRASDYALQNGNIDLYEELKRVQKQNDFNSCNLALNKFSVNDRFNAEIAKKLAQCNYQQDAEKFMEAYKLSHAESVNREEEMRSNFKVDPMSNMNKTGCLVWDKKTQTPYDVILTKTDVSYGMYGMHNFYKMQILTQLFDSAAASGEKEEGAGSSRVYVLFTRWGRIGDSGQCQRTPFANLGEARLEFFKIFKQKTGNDFAETCLEKSKQFESKPRRYTLVKLESRTKLKLKDINFSLFDSNGNEANKASLIRYQNSLFQKSALYDPKNPRQTVAFKQFWSDLLNLDYLKSTIRQNTTLSVSYLPLTQLSDESINKAYDLLNKQLKPLIERRMELEKLSKKEYLMEYMNLLDQINKFSNEFYELIPQMNYNYEKLKPISNEKELNTQLCLLNQLTNAHVACRILMGARQNSSSHNPFEYVYRALDCRMEIVDPSSSEAQYILRYTNSKESFRVKQILKFERANEQSRFDQFVKQSNDSNRVRNRFLLWHGTATENLISIMCKGLCKSPNDSSRTNGQRYGEGVYFSDSFEFSAGYASGIKVAKSRAKSTESKRVYMLLCEVALGTVKELRTSYETLDSLPAGFDSVKAIGRQEPDQSNNIYMPNGAIMPLGEMVDTPYMIGESYYSRNSNYNQYVVYNESQVCIRYIVQCEVE